jgi:hypothetical protein
MTETLGAAADTFMKIMDNQPLSLALVVMNLLLVWFIFKSTSMYNTARQEFSKILVEWQSKTQTIMADCVSKEVMEMVLKALERDRETYRALLPSHREEVVIRREDAEQEPPL